MSERDVKGVIPLLKAAQLHCVCPICMYLFHDPAGLPCGHVFCRACLNRCLQDRNQCPLCNRASSSRRSIIPLPNLALFTSAVGKIMERAVPVVVKDESKEEEGGEERCTHVDEHQQQVDGTEAPRSADLSPPARQRVRTEETRTPATVVTKTRASPETLPHDDQRDHGTASETQRFLMNELSLTEWSSSQFFNPQVHHFSSFVGVAATPVRESAETQPLGPFGPSLTPPRHGSQARRGQPGTASVRQGLSGTLVPATCEDAGPLGDGRATTPVLSQSFMPEGGLTTGPSPCSETDACARTERTSLADLTSLHAHLSPGQPRSQRLNFTPPRCWHHSESAAPAETNPSSSFAGCCCLCGLDTTDRDSVRGFLLSLLRSAGAHCEASELAELTQEKLEALLGPLWTITLETTTHGAPDTRPAGEAGGMTSSLSVVAHHNCLAWAGLVPGEAAGRRQKRFFTPSLGEEGGGGAAQGPDEVARAAFTVDKEAELTRSPLASLVGYLVGSNEGVKEEHQGACCAVCRRGEAFEVAVGVVIREENAESCRGDATSAHLAATRYKAALPPTLGLLTCHATAPAPVCSHQRRTFHLPCALLAGADVCLVLGLDPSDAPAEEVEVWCGPCHRKKMKAKR